MDQRFFSWDMADALAAVLAFSAAFAVPAVASAVTVDVTPSDS